MASTLGGVIFEIVRFELISNSSNLVPRFSKLTSLVPLRSKVEAMLDPRAMGGEEVFSRKEVSGGAKTKGVDLV